MNSGEEQTFPGSDGGAAEHGGGAALELGQEVSIADFDGTIRFIGETKFATGRWVGIELLEAVGKNNGTVQDVTYFTCPPNHGIFVRDAVVKPRRGGRAIAEATAVVSVQVPNTGAAPDAGNDSDSEGELVQRVKTEGRRYGVSAEAAARLLSDEAWTPPVHAKDPQAREQITEMIRTSRDSKVHMLFGSLRADTFEKVIDAVFLKPVAAGERVIQLGDDGDFFYIVKVGRFDILVMKPVGEEDGPQELVKVFEADPGYSFGELALLYNAPRSATVVATEASEVWALEREAFRRLVVQSFEDRFKESVDFIKRCDLFQELSPEQIASLAEVLEEEDFEEDEAILEQGDRDNKMYIMQKGKAVACIKGDQGEVEVMRFQAGDYFGEIALLLGEPRQASVYAVGAATCMHITRDTFNRVLGPLRDFLQRNIGKYQKYQEAIVAASSSELAAPTRDGPRLSYASLTTTPRTGGDSMEEIFEGAASHRASRTTKRFRTRTEAQVSPEEAGQAAGGDAAADAAEESAVGEASTPGMSLADKVAADFRNPWLVSPCGAFAVPDCQLEMFGGLRPQQKFADDKVVLARAQVTPTQDGLQDTYSWKGPCWFKGSTRVSVLCQKGQKSPSDPTPNQDNYFVLHIGRLGIYGVCDGHGPFGHLVSFRLVQTLPHFLTANPNFGKDWALALKEAFLSAQQELLAFCREHSVNVEASGAAGSVLVFEGPSVHIAHIGDAGAMVASYNRRDSRLICGTEDHKPQLPKERERLEAAGSEVRELDKDNFRIYRRGTDFPGLTMSRAFGDTACAGVFQEPEYRSFFLQPGDETYAIVASDGLWEFLTYEKVVDLSAKKLRLKGPTETVRFLTEASRKRWAYCCGDYCDDVTVLLIQWNVKEKNSTPEDNFVLTVTRDE